MDGTGHGTPAVLNQNLTLNSPGNPAKPGSFMSIFATGGGVLQPNGIDGEISVPPLKRTVAQAFVVFGYRLVQEVEQPVEQPAEYSGVAPALVSGVIQVNVRVPDSVSGKVPVQLCFVGGSCSAPVDVAIQ